MCVARLQKIYGSRKSKIAYVFYFLISFTLFIVFSKEIVGIVALFGNVDILIVLIHKFVNLKSSNSLIYRLLETQLFLKSFQIL